MIKKKSCSNCSRGSTIAINDDILCKIKGVVTPNYLCSRYKQAETAKSFKEMNYKCIECENFILAEDTDFTGKSGKGLCKLFSVRFFDGYQKGACSKFVKNSKPKIVEYGNIG